MTPGPAQQAQLRRLDRAAAVARRTGPVALLVGLVSYAVGFVSQFTLEVDEACTLQHGQPFVPSEAFPEGSSWSWFPLSQPCNADFDLVPAWVNPAVVLAAVALVASAVAVLVLAVLRRRALLASPSTPEAL